LAQYWYRRDDEKSGSKKVTMEYLTKQSLEELVLQRECTGILQRFVTPKGPQNEVMRVVWTPGVVLMERRQNRHSITDRMINLYDRAATYDGKPHDSQTFEIRAQPTIDALNQMIDSIRQHVYHVTRQEIIRMVAFFKEDVNGHIWFLDASSIRLSSRDNKVPKPLDLEGHTPAPQEIVHLPPINQKEKHKSAQRTWNRCPCCAELILQVVPNYITVKQAVEVFHMMTQSRYYQETGEMPEDRFGYRMSANLYDMRRVIALEEGSAFKIPTPVGNKSAKGLFGKVKSQLIKDESDLANSLMIPPAVRNHFKDAGPHELQGQLHDLDFLASEIGVCTACWLRHNEDDLAAQLDLLRFYGSPNDQAETISADRISKTHQKKKKKKSKRREEERFIRSASCPPTMPRSFLPTMPVITEELHNSSMDALRNRAKREKKGGRKQSMELRSPQFLSVSPDQTRNHSERMLNEDIRTGITFPRPRGRRPPKVDAFSAYDTLYL